MKKPVLRNREIYRIGNNVLKSVRLPDEEIDRIVADPGLVDRLRAAMESGQYVADRAGKANGWPLRYILRRQYAWSAAAVVLLLAGVMGLVVVTIQSDTTSNLAEIVQPVDVPQIALDAVDIPEIEVISDNVRKVPGPLGRKSIKTIKTRSDKTPALQAKEIEMGEFQALTYAGELEGLGDGGRIVRVALSPASLFAMGIDVQLENSTEKIPADLLISADGVMTGVRLEKKNQER